MKVTPVISIALAVGVIASAGLAFYAGFMSGKGGCEARVIAAAHKFVQQRKRFIQRVNARAAADANRTYDRARMRQNKYETALDVIAHYGLVLDQCRFPGEVRKAIGEIN